MSNRILIFTLLAFEEANKMLKTVKSNSLTNKVTAEKKIPILGEIHNQNHPSNKWGMIKEKTVEVCTVFVDMTDGPS
jgi:hypothetical protein